MVCLSVHPLVHMYVRHAFSKIIQMMIELPGWSCLFLRTLILTSSNTYRSKFHGHISEKVKVKNQVMHEKEKNISKRLYKSIAHSLN